MSIITIIIIIIIMIMMTEEAKLPSPRTRDEEGPSKLP